MSNFERNACVTSRRRSRTWLTALAVLILVVAGVFFSTDRWGETATRTGGGAPREQALSADGPSHSGVPDMQGR